MYNNVLPNLISSKETLKFKFPTYYFVSGFLHPMLPVITSEGLWIDKIKASKSFNHS